MRDHVDEALDFNRALRLFVEAVIPTCALCKKQGGKMEPMPVGWGNVSVHPDCKQEHTPRFNAMWGRSAINNNPATSAVDETTWLPSGITNRQSHRAGQAARAIVKPTEPIFLKNPLRVVGGITPEQEVAVDRETETQVAAWKARNQHEKRRVWERKTRKAQRRAAVTPKGDVVESALDLFHEAHARVTLFGIGEELSERECDPKKTNKPWRTSGGPKKFAVCASDDGEKKLVRFGDPNMEIKRDSPERRKNFRARHGCATPGPKTKAKYWACKTWEGKKRVSDVVESTAGRSIQTRKDLVPGGRGDKLSEKDVDPEQLRMGIEVEKEHTKNAVLAKEIALDHLAENPKYYTALKKMEKGFKESADDQSAAQAAKAWQQAEERAHLSGDPEHVKAEEEAHARLMGHRDDIAYNMDSGGGPEQSTKYANTFLAQNFISPDNASDHEHHVRQLAKIHGLTPRSTPGRFTAHDADHAYDFHDSVSEHYGIHDAVKFGQHTQHAASSTLGSPVDVDLAALKKQHEGLGDAWSATKGAWHAAKRGAIGAAAGLALAGGLAAPAHAQSAPPPEHDPFMQQLLQTPHASTASVTSATPPRTTPAPASPSMGLPIGPVRDADQALGRLAADANEPAQAERRERFVQRRDEINKIQDPKSRAAQLNSLYRSYTRNPGDADPEGAETFYNALLGPR